MLASRLLLRASRSNAIAIGLRQHGAVKIPAPATPARLFSSIRTTPLKRPSILALSVVQQPTIIPLTSARFKSTSTSTPPDVNTTPATETSELAPFDTVSSLDFTALSDAQKAIPEHIGFLKELGLDFGWGPTSCMQWFLEHVHVWSGTPWWASIVLATVIIRVLQLPGYLRLSDVGARMKEVTPFAQPIMDRYKAASTTRDLMAMQIARQELEGIYKGAGINRLWLLWPIAQFPIFFGFYNLLRKMAEIPVPGLVDGGALWFTNLTIADPFIALPLISAGSIAATIAWGGESGNMAMAPHIRKGLMVGLPLVSLLFFWKWPAALTVYFATSSLLGLTQTFLLKNPTLRNWLGLYPVVQHEPPPTNISNLRIIDAASGPSKPVDTQANIAEKVKSMMGKNSETVKDVSKWFKDGSEKRKLESYERRRDEEETERRRAVIESKRRRALKDEF